VAARKRSERLQLQLGRCWKPERIRGAVRREKRGHCFRVIVSVKGGRVVIEIQLNLNLYSESTCHDKF